MGALRLLTALEIEQILGGDIRHQVTISYSPHFLNKTIDFRIFLY